MPTVKNLRNLKRSFVETIQQEILSGELKPGDKLLSEREIALRMGISRGSVNQGILDLERMGFIRVVPRKGAYVTDYLKNGTPETLSAIMSHDSALVDSELFGDLMEMRMLIERECVRLACDRISSESRSMLDEKLSQLYQARGTELAKALYDFHRCIVGISGNSIYMMIFRSFEKMMLNLLEAHYHNESEIYKTIPIYEGLAAAISQKDSSGADSLIVKILVQATDYLNTYYDHRN